MIKSKIFLCAESVICDTGTNNISIFNVLQNISSSGFPVLIHKFTIFSVMERSKEDLEELSCELKIANNDEELLIKPLNVDFQNKKRIRTTVNIKGLTIPNSGVLDIILSYEGRVLGSYEISVDKIEGGPSPK